MQMSLWSKKFLGCDLFQFVLHWESCPNVGSETWLTNTLFCNCSSYTLGGISYSASFIHLI